jgi:hypothetical protein
VWIHEKITEASSEQKKGQATHSSTTLKVEPTPDKPGEIIFQSDARLEISLYFPKILLWILPMSREKSNALGSEFTQKSLRQQLTAHCPERRKLVSLDHVGNVAVDVNISSIPILSHDEI